MARVVDLTGENVTRQRRKERNFGTKTDLPSTSVERGNTHWTDGSNVNIDGFLGIAGTASVSGTLRVTGLLDVTGTLNGSGTNNFSGTNNLSGTNKLTGPTTVAGNFEIIAGGLFKAGASTINPDGSAKFGALNIGADGKLSAGQFSLNPDGSAKFGLFDIAANGNLASKGTLSIEGVTTLKNDLNVTAGGKIKAGNLEIEPANGGQINFLNGSLSSTSFGALLNNSIKVELQGPRVDLTSTKTWINGQLEASGIARFNSGVWMGGLPTTSQPANLHITSQGQMFRSTATP